MPEFLPKYWKILLSINLAFIFIVIGFDHHHLHDENSLLENLQAFFLVSATILYFYLTRSGYDSRDSRLAYMGLGLLCFSFSLREVDIEQLPILEYIGFLFHGVGRTLLLLVLWCVFFKQVYDHGEIKLLVVKLLGFRYLQFLNVSFLLLVAGAIFDREFWHIEHARLYEELAETNAYLFLVIPAIYACFYRYTQSRNCDPRNHSGWTE